MKLKDIMTESIISCDIKDFMIDAAKKMKKNDIGFLPIVQNKKIVGVMTDRDIVVKALANNGKEAQISSYMTKELITISENADLNDAIELMGQKRVKRLLVVSDHRVVGILSLADLLSYITDTEKLLHCLQEMNFVSKNKANQEAEIDEFYL